MTIPTSHALVTEPPVWLITGCSTGFGPQLARLAIEHGYRTVMTAHDPSRLEGYGATDNVKAVASGNPPHHLLLGNDAFEGAMAGLDELRTDFTAGESVARAADFPKSQEAAPV